MQETAETTHEPSDVGASDEEVAKELAKSFAGLRTQIARKIVGHDDIVELLLTSLLARGHALLVGVPGLAKTLLIRSLAECLGLDFQRVQFTPDLMPSDITGTDILEEDAETGRRGFRFAKGPVFTNVLLADEINRTPPKTQAALLQAMAEREVSVGGRTYPLPAPYVVFATQNPIEQEGTYPLPEAQLDRFLFELHVPYPTEAEEIEIVRRTTGAEDAALEPMITREALLRFQALVPRTPAAPHVIERAVRLARATRPDAKGASELVKENLTFGAGPRASQGLISAAKAKALLGGRYAAEVEDVEAVALAVLRHRIVPSYQARAAGVSTSAIIEAALQASR